MRTALLVALVGLAMIPTALATDEGKPDPATAPTDPAAEPRCPDGEVESPEGCSEQAWVDDCPPDMFCAASDPGAGANSTPFGPDGCIECSGPAPAQANDTEKPTTCMDGADEGEDCRDDVYYLGGPTRGDPDCMTCRGDVEDDAEDGTVQDAEPVSAVEPKDDKPAPGAGMLMALGLIGMAALVRRVR